MDGSAARATKLGDDSKEPYMPDPNPIDLETDPRFPSGRWTGFFLQTQAPNPGKHQMELLLTFRQGTLTGEGRDWVGKFVIKGRYTTADGKCHWTKRYLGKHDVFYQGYNQCKGIWGTWEISPFRGGFQFSENLFAAVEDFGGDAGQAGHVDAIALVGAAGGDLVQEDNVVLPFADQDIIVAQAGKGFGQLGQFVVMAGEESAAADLIVQIFGDGPGQRDAVVGAGAAADLVEDDQALRTGIIEDVGRLGHLDHEGAVAPAQLIVVADTGENPVHDAYAARFCRHKAAHLGQQGQQRHLADEGAFARHVRPGDEPEQAARRLQEPVIGNESSRGQQLLQNRMAAVANVQDRLPAQFRADILARDRQLRQSGQDIQIGQHFPGLQ